jgi:predicted XRE-type DNA-binding protein
MHSSAVIREIDRLIQQGVLSQRQISARLGVSRGIVSAVASGRRGMYGKDSLKIHSPCVPETIPTRCPGCGYRVYLPCIICSIRAHQARQNLLKHLLRQRPKIIQNNAPSKSRTMVSRQRAG